MNTEEARLAFYEIKRCGFFKRGADTPDFCDIAEVISELRNWTKGKALGQTCPFEVKDGDEITPTYCFGITQDSTTGDVLLTTWNSVPSTGNAVASVDPASLVGAPTVNLTDIPKDAIPGFATYFWIMPSLKILATVNFQHRLNGHVALGKLINEYMAKFSRFVVREKNNGDERKILGYAANSDSPYQDLIPSFLSKEMRRPGKVDVIRSNRAKIGKIIRKNKFETRLKNEKSVIKSVVEYLGMTKPVSSIHEIPIKYEINLNPTDKELEEIIATWEGNHDSSWDDVGFKLSGDAATYWLSHSLVRDVIDLEVKRSNAEVVDGSSLLQALTAKKESLLRRANK